MSGTEYAVAIYPRVSLSGRSLNLMSTIMHSQLNGDKNTSFSALGVRLDKVRLPRRTQLVILAAGLVYLVVFHWSLLPQALMFVISLRTEVDHCPQSSGANDILVVLRTGASEALEKLLIHFNTTLRCVPNYVIHSDDAEIIDGHEIHDVFQDVNKTLIATEPAFAPYRHLQSHGRPGLVSMPHYGSWPTGSPDNPN